MIVFTPYSALLGGVLIGLSACVLMWSIGRIAGISGIAAGALSTSGSERSWRLSFLAGLILGAGICIHALGIEWTPRIDFPTWLVIIAGVLVGFGTRLGSGCTSGHGICGISRLSKRSIVATVVFMGTGMATVFLVRHVAGLGT